MRTQEQIQQLKKVSIMDYLASKGYKPTSKSGIHFMYFSPLRNEDTPSFTVNPIKNTFYDLGNTEDKGNIIELVQKLERISFLEALKVVESMDLMKEKNNDEPFVFLSLSQTSTEGKKYEITAVKDIQHPALITYLKSRKISYDTAFRYIKEIHYRNDKGNFFGVGFQNDNGGLVVRSGVAKKPINLGKAGIKTFVVPESKSVAIFEGMFDLLSAIEHHGHAPRCTTIALNSLSNLSQAVPMLKQAEKIYTYLDLDDNQSGQNATKKIMETYQNVTDMSGIYAGYKDFNEFLVKKIQ